MKDEIGGLPIAKFMGRRAKMQSVLGGNSKETKKATVVNNAVVKHEI